MARPNNSMLDGLLQGRQSKVLIERHDTISLPLFHMLLLYIASVYTERDARKSGVPACVVGNICIILDYVGNVG